MPNDIECASNFLRDIFEKSRHMFLKRNELIKLFEYYLAYPITLKPLFPDNILHDFPYKPKSGSLFIINENQGKHGSALGEITSDTMNFEICKERTKNISQFIDGYQRQCQPLGSSKQSRRVSSQILKTTGSKIPHIKVSYFNLKTESFNSTDLDFEIEKKENPLLKRSEEEFKSDKSTKNLQNLLKDQNMKQNDLKVDSLSCNRNRNSEKNIVKDNIDVHFSDLKNSTPDSDIEGDFQKFNEKTIKNENNYNFSKQKIFSKLNSPKSIQLQKRVYQLIEVPDLYIFHYLFVETHNFDKYKRFESKQNPKTQFFEAPLIISSKFQIDSDRNDNVTDGRSKRDSQDFEYDKIRSMEDFYYKSLKIKAISPLKSTVRGGESMILVFNKKIKSSVKVVLVLFGNRQVTAKILNGFAVQVAIPISDAPCKIKPTVLIDNTHTIVNKRCNFTYLSDPFEEFNKDIKNILDLEESETNNDINSYSKISREESAHKSEENESLNESASHCKLFKENIPSTNNFDEIFKLPSVKEVEDKNLLFGEENMVDDMENCWLNKDSIENLSLFPKHYETQKQRHLFENVRIIQKNVRGWISRRRYGLLKNAVIKLQKRFKKNQKVK
jgi:hypothetical protein